MTKNTKHNNQGAVKIVKQNEPTKIRASSMIEQPNGQKISLMIQIKQIDQSKINENYENLIRQKVKGFSEEERFVAKDFACLTKVLKIYQAALKQKQDDYQELQRKYHLLTRTNKKYATKNDELRESSQNRINKDADHSHRTKSNSCNATDQLAKKNKRNEIRQTDGFGQLVQPQRNPENFLQIVNAQGMRELNIQSGAIALPKGRLISKVTHGKDPEDQLPQINHILILQTLKVQQQQSQVEPEPKPKSKPKMNESSEAAKIHQFSNQQPATDTFVSEEQQSLIQIKGSLRSIIHSASDTLQKPKQLMDLADSSISSTLSAPASKVISAYPFLKDMIKTNKMLQSRLRKVRYEG